MQSIKTGDRLDRGVQAAQVEIKFARNGDIDYVVELVPAGTTAGAGHRLRVVDPLSWYASRKPPPPASAERTCSGGRFSGDCSGGWPHCRRTVTSRGASVRRPIPP